MNRRFALVRRASHTVFTLLFVGTAMLCATHGARAQVPVPAPPKPVPADTLKRDTLKADTLKKITRDPAFIQDSLLRVDSLRQQAHNDSLPKPFPTLNASNGPIGFAAGTWVWDQDALLREGPITLGDLLRRIPAMSALRAGGYEQPEAVTAFALTRGRVQIEVDGYVLDPMTSSTYDLAGIELINLTGVRVERHLNMIRIKLTTAQSTQTTPYTRLEVATGQPDLNVFRAIFLVPNVIVGPVGAAIDRVGADGTGAREQASALGGWAKWSWSNRTRGVQLEYRRQNLKREGVSPWLTNQTRQDIVLRARSQITTGLTAELFGGKSSTREAGDTATVKTTAGTITTSVLDTLDALVRSHWQGGARAAFARGPAYASATLRIRNADALPKQELELTGGFDASILHVGGDFAQQTWKIGPGASTYDVRAQAGPISGLGAFVEVAGGDRGAPIYHDSAGITTLDTHTVNARSAMRAGATLQRFGIDGGGALLKINATASAPFGLPFDSAFAPSRTIDATGFEAWGRVGFFKNRFFADASYTYWTKSGGWSYLPTRQWRIAGEAHLTPLASGNFELLARLESVFRGPMLAYGAPAPGDQPQLQFEPLAQNSILNGYLQIRIIDVRIFLQSEDMLGKGRLDIPNRLIPGPRLYYGVKWQLFN